MEKLIFATSNKGKMKEIRMILADYPGEILSLQEAGIDIEIVEDGQTFEDNALIKARTIAKMTHAIVLADDSGLEVDAMDKAPGVLSARFMGEDTPYSIKNQTIMDRLEGLPDAQRTARFVCAIAAVFPDGTEKTTRGTIEGIIGHEPAGSNGFGYDPIFYLPDKGCTTAQLSPEEKNKISHRGKALEAMKATIFAYLKK